MFADEILSECPRNSLYMGLLGESLLVLDAGAVPGSDPDLRV